MRMKRAEARLTFGPFEIDPGTGELRKHGTLVKLQPQPFRVLLLLASHPGELVSRETIRHELWGDGTNVEFDAGLNFCIGQIRNALLDNARRPRYIETLAKRGYRFLAPAATVEPPPKPVPAPSETLSTVAAPASSPSLPPRPGRWTRWLTAGVVAGLALLIGLGWRHLSTDRSTRILVRPFVAVALQEDEAWFGDSLAQQLAYSLAETKKCRWPRGHYL